jgi:F-type H+-transporting ATPase subunit a
MLLALEFPPVSHLIEWPDMFLKGSTFAINKIALLCLISAAIVLFLFVFGGRRAELVPRGLQNIMEMGVEFVRDGIAVQIMGPAGLAWAPFLVTLFFFIFFCNIWEVIPGIQMPVNARIAIPMFLALVVWVIYNAMGVMKQGLFGYLKSNMFPPGVPKAMYILLTPIETLSNFILRPFSLMIRLFANMLAGHMLLVTFALLAASLWSRGPGLIILPLPAITLVVLTAFEIFVAGMQAFIFTMLTAVYIDMASHAHH